MARERKPQKDRTSFVIAVVLHVVLIGGVTFWAWKTGKLEQMRQAVLQYVRSDKKDQKPDSKPIQQKSTPQAKLPPINQGLPPSASSGTRRAVASDAPSAVADTFFQDTRKQVEGPSAGPSSMSRPTNATPMISKSSLPAPRPVFAAPPKATIKQLLAERSKAAASIESFGSEQISRSSVKDAGDIVSRVSGATVVEGKYAVIRGLTDRYSAATLNGAELPSADPYRRSAGLNMFPAKIIDRVTVTKTFTPDQPGSFTGGNINIVTKSFPEKAFASLEIGAAYNSQATGNKNFLTTSGGSTDWLGMDDGTRKMDKELWNQPLNIPSWRSQLGRPISLTSTSPTTKRNLADAAEIERLTELAGPADFAPRTKAPPPAPNITAAFGDTAYFLGRPVGVFFSLPYSHGYGFYDDGVVTRVTYNRPDDPQTLVTEKTFTEAKGVEEVNWAGTASLTYQLHPDHQIGYNFLFNQSSDNSARVRKGSDPDNSLLKMQLNRLAYIERNLTTHQFRGEHLFPVLGDLEFNWLATFSDTSQDLPDMRLYDTDSGKFGLGGLPNQYPSRFWQELSEKNQNLKLDFVQPFHPRDALNAELKFGFFKNSATRNYRERVLKYDSPSYGVDPNQFLTEDRVGAVNPPATNGNFVTYTWGSYLKPPTDFSFYDGDNQVTALYAMTDFPLLENLRLIGGARLERTDIKLTAFTTTISEGVVPGTTNSSALQQNDLLPAIGLVWNMASNMNIRLNYAKTVARPSFRELAPVRIFDFEYDAYVVGNPALQMSEIQNYDARWEWFPRPGEIFSVGVFYKEIKKPIEKKFISGTGDIYTFVNRPEGKVYGVEFEARKSLDLVSPYLRDWNLGGNLSLIQSEQDVPEQDRQNHTRPDLLDSTRPLADQSPYIINLDLTYDNPRWGSTVSFNYNIFGPRLLITSLNSPDVYEQPAAQFDVVFSQRIGRNLRLKLAAKNLLNPEIKRTYGEGDEATYSSYTRGRTYSLSVTCDF
ncbi:MAG: TonB-dependent receptor [Verrucomicrobia bacterium]|jgi:outer membrane receptor protein involved in Fe transport|nr:TonB-dependent receptor [Verrucomicrobiota bacterium]